MIRYNCANGPVDMEEDKNGYWVKFEDYNLKELTHNKEMEKAYNRFAEEIQKYENLKEDSKTIDNLRNAVIAMSVVIFGGLMSFLFTWI